MKRRIISLTIASLAYGSPHVFSVTDDLLAYPQYEIVFPESYITDKDALSRLSYASSLSSASTTSTAHPSQDASTSPAPPGELSQSPPDPISPDDQPQSASTYERLILDHTPYLCSIPQAPPPSTNHTTASKAAADEAAELARATERGWDLLQEMSGQCLYFISGWWSYSFCYAASVKQFHQSPPGKDTPMFPPVEDPTTPSYVLGKFGERKVNGHRVGAVGSRAEKEAGLGMEDKSGATTQVQAKGTASSRYLSQKLSGGTTCDLTGAPRRVEIQFHCHPQSADRIGWIKEVSTCAYLMVIYTPRLCNDVAFLPPREEKAEQISCREVVKEEEVGEWKAKKVRAAERMLVGAGGAQAAAGGGRPVVAGIEVGGMKLVGREGKRLEVPQNIQPGSHGHGSGGHDQVELLMRQDPKEKGGKIHRMSDEEMKKMGLDAKVVELARRELEAVAGGKGWRLEVFEVDGGTELRGVVDGDDDDEDEGGEGEDEAYETSEEATRLERGHAGGDAEKVTKPKKGQVAGDRKEAKRPADETKDKSEKQKQQHQQREEEEEAAAEGSQEEYKDEL